MFDLRERRIELGMTREEFIRAVAPEVKRGTVVNIEIHRTRLRDIDMIAIRKIASVLKCKINDLLPKPTVTIFPCKTKKVNPVKLDIELHQKYGKKLQAKRKADIRPPMLANTALICKWDRRVITREGELQNLLLLTTKL